MDFQEYTDYFKSILDKASGEAEPPYSNPEYLDYTKLNWSRMNRWFKTGKLSDEVLRVLAEINKPQSWLIITEPWCGDAAHNIPFLELISRQNPLISVIYELRDSPPNSIEKYLTNGTKSIPKLIIRDNEGKDLATWGPRPEGCQKMFAELVQEKAPFDKIKVEIQNWYNENKGEAIQREMANVLRETLESAT